ncbi:MAG: hypothetical protein WC251_03780 [Candidatus Izemoplasmatales bacterium]
MKRATLISSIIYENAFAYVLIFIFVVFISYLLQGVSSSSRSYYELIKLCEDAGIGDKVLVNGADFAHPFFDDDLIEQKLDAIAGMTEIESLSMTYFQGFIAKGQSSEDSETIYTLDGIYSDIYGKMTYPLECGEWPNEPCEIALAENMRQYYEVGDQIQVGVYHFTGAGNSGNVDIVDMFLTVTGFIPMDAQMLDWKVNGNQPDISDMSVTFRELEEGFVPATRLVMGVGIPPEDEFGVPFRSSYGCAALWITPSKDYTPEQLKSLLTQYFDEGQIYIGDELIKRYHVNYQTEYQAMVRKLIIVFSLALTTMFSSVFLQLRKKRLEMTVYYICGVTWRQSIGLFCIVYIPIILLSFLSGTAIFMAFRENRRWFDGKDSLWILLILIAVSFLFILPLYLLARRSSPVEQTRKD